MKYNRPTNKDIQDAFQDAWNEFGDDKSTEFLIAITSERLDIEYSDVVDGLCNEGEA